MRESPYRILEEALRPHLGARAQVVLEEGLKRLGKRPEELSENCLLYTSDAADE